MCVAGFPARDGIFAKWPVGLRALTGSLLLTLLAGCLRHRQMADMVSMASQPATASRMLTDRDLAVLEAALREELHHADANETVFISIGSFVDQRDDPPPGFLDRLRDLHLTLKAASAARLPKDGEMESPNRYRGVEDPATGKRSNIYWAHINEWIFRDEGGGQYWFLLRSIERRRERSRF